MIEEAFQTAMFGCWGFDNSKDYIGGWNCTIFLEKDAHFMSLINHTIGWINPISNGGYFMYETAAWTFIAGQRSKICYNAKYRIPGCEKYRP